MTGAFFVAYMLLEGFADGTHAIAIYCPSQCRLTWKTAIGRTEKCIEPNSLVANMLDARKWISVICVPCDWKKGNNQFGVQLLANGFRRQCSNNNLNNKQKNEYLWNRYVLFVCASCGCAALPVMWAVFFAIQPILADRVLFCRQCKR